MLINETKIRTAGAAAVTAEPAIHIALLLRDSLSITALSIFMTGSEAIIAAIIKKQLFLNRVEASKEANELPFKQNIPLSTAAITPVFSNLKRTQPKYTTKRRYRLGITLSFFSFFPKNAFSKAINTKK